MSGQQYQIRGDTRANIELVTPASKELAVVTDKKELVVGDGSTLGGQPLARKNKTESLTPAQITANQNDYAPTGYNRHIGTMVLSSDAKRRITGLAGGSTDHAIFLINGGSQQIVLSDQDAGSLAANRFDLNGDITLMPKGAVRLFYNASASAWQRMSGGQKSSSIPEEFLLTGTITPAQITANQNDYAPVDGVIATKTVALATTLRLSSDVSRNITGIVDPRDGSIKTIINVGNNPIVLQNANAGSSSANRFDFGADVTLSAKQSARIRYDGGDSRWKLEASTAGSAVGAGAVTAQTLAGSALGPFAGLVNGTIVASVAASALTVAIKTLAGADPSVADPVYVLVRNATPATGDYVVLTITAATSIVISSGSAMGVVANSTAFALWAVGFNDAGTFRLGLINCLIGTDIYPLAAWPIASSTAEGGAGAADAAQTFYTGTAVTAKSYAILARLSWETGLAVVASWSSTPTRIQLCGAGMAMPGTPVGSAFIRNGTVATGTTIIPADNTIPQNTEGTQFISKSIAPSSAANVLRVNATVQLQYTASGYIISALFQDSISNALTAQLAYYGADQNPFSHSIAYEMIAGATAQTTFKVRSGGGVAGTVTFSGNNSSSLFSGIMASTLKIEEIMA